MLFKEIERPARRGHMASGVGDELDAILDTQRFKWHGCPFKFIGLIGIVISE